MKNTQNIFSLFIFSVFLMLGSLVTSTVQVSAQSGCIISIEKIANPDDDTEFDFTVSGIANFEMPLSDPSLPEFGFDFPVGTEVTVLEEVTPGWVLDDIVCTEGTTNCGNDAFEPCLRITIDLETNSITAFCEDNDEGSCTFTNSRIPPPPLAQVPTLSEWGLIAMAGILGIVGFMVIRRKKASA